MRQTFLSFLFPIFLSAEITTSSISSEKASYDGNALVLNGSVKLEHALGKLQSGSARLLRESNDSSFTSVHLQNDVFITLKNRGTISCACADFDFNALKGQLIPKIGEMVRFINLHTGPLSFASNEAQIEFSEEDNILKVTKIEANKGVQVQYGEDFLLTADSATYSNTKTPYIWATPNCILNHYEDRIKADRIEVLPESAKVILTAPKGELTPSAFHETESVQFSCNKLIWERAPQVLTLKGNIAIHDGGIGTIHCEDEVELRQKEQDGKWILNSISAKGKTELQCKLDEDMEHLLVCYGQMQLDQDRLVLTLESPPQYPLEYFHYGMRLCADQAALSYIQEEHSIAPQKLELRGNIQLTSTKNALRCAIADQFAYYPEEKKMILSAKQQGNVLFWDQEQELSISAKEVHIIHTERGENVKGVGNVRFAFSSAENTLLKNLFPFYQPKGGHNE